jgi:hypothetical protein
MQDCAHSPVAAVTAADELENHGFMSSSDGDRVLRAARDRVADLNTCSFLVQ